ncbi:MAG: hypothetical protein Q8M16_11285 [Pirellulaceae bacterium]|nr:hypothetical protein [Pirellulaceae bacterium]
MSLVIESNSDCCSLTMTEIRMRVANIKANWSDEEREVRSHQGRNRRRSLGDLLGGRTPAEFQLSLLQTVELEEVAIGF